LRAYFALLVALFIAVAASAAVYVSIQADRDARAGARSDAAFAAHTSATQLGSLVTDVRAAVSSLVLSLRHQPLPTALAPNCSLTFGTGSGVEQGHIDVLLPDGLVVCSSRARPGVTSLPGYQRAGWLARARTNRLFLAPALDAATGRRVLIVTAPIPGRGIVAAFLDLDTIGPALAKLFGGGNPVEFLVTTRNGERVIARSLHPERWVGRSLAGSAFAASAGSLERRDLDGTRRLYQDAGVPGTDWRFSAGIEKAAALSAGNRLRDRQLAIIVGGLAVVLLAAFVVYRRVALPITRLRAAVSATSPYDDPEPIRVVGPAEVTGLAEDVNGLVESVNRELHERVSAERTYRLLFEGSPLPMCVCERDSLQILEANDAAVERYGYTSDEFRGLGVLDLATAPERATVRAMFASPTPVERLGPFRHRARDGTEFEVRITTYPVTFAGGPARFLLLEDVGERERLERQLRQAQRLESLGQLAGGVAHDFNNLLGVIMGFASFAKERTANVGGDQADLHHSVEQIEQAAVRAAALTHQLLAFARREVVQPTIVDAGSVVAGLEALLERTLGARVDLVTSLDRDLWPVEIDRGQLEQVVINLAVNARDAMPDGGRLAIHVDDLVVDPDYAASRPGVPTGRYVRLSVGDSGVGMDQATVQRAFDPFFTTKPPGEGTGLGLATVYGIVTQAGGRVQIYSEPGHGTTVTVLLPASDAGTPSPEERPVQVELTGGSETVLVVEDEDALREVTARMLRRNGYAVLTAADGPEAIELVREHQGRIDLLVSDVVMPRMLGREVAERIQELQPDIRVLYVSGYAESILGSKGTLEAGVRLLEKPFSEPALLTTLREILDPPR
jgi:PAS domain S-box-containing protein